MARHHCSPSACASPALAATMLVSRSDPLHAPDRPQSYVHPAGLILILSLAPSAGWSSGARASSVVFFVLCACARLPGGRGAPSGFAAGAARAAGRAQTRPGGVCFLLILPPAARPLAIRAPPALAPPLSG